MNLGLPNLAYLQEGHPHGRSWSHSEWCLLWLLAEARWWAEEYRDLYDAAGRAVDPLPWLFAEKVASTSSEEE